MLETLLGPEIGKMIAGAAVFLFGFLFGLVRPHGIPASAVDPVTAYPNCATGRFRAATRLRPRVKFVARAEPPAQPAGRVQVSDHARQQLDAGLPKRSSRNTCAVAASPFTASCAPRAGTNVL